MLDVAEKLAGQVANGQAAPPHKRREQVAVRVMEKDRLLGIRAVNDPVRQGQ